MVDAIISRLNIYRKLGDDTFAQLTEEDFHFQPDPVSNSIAVIIQHMHGNMLSRWTNFLTEDGEKEWRKRDEEFEVHPHSKEELLRLWNEGWDVVISTIGSLKEEDMPKRVHIRGKSLTVLDAILRQLAHYAYHVGQIVYLVRMRRLGEWKSLSIPKKVG